MSGDQAEPDGVHDDPSDSSAQTPAAGTADGARSTSSGVSDSTTTSDPTTTSGPTTAPRREDRPDLAARRRRSGELDWADDAASTSRRRRWLVGSIAAVIVIALAIGLSVYLLKRPSTQSSPPPPDSSSAPAPASAVLTAGSMLTPAQAALILPGTTWKVASDQSGQETTTSAACLSPAAVQNAPNPQAIRSRTLTAGAGGPMVLHQAQAFGTADESTVDYALLTKALGDCDLANSYLLSGSVITGLGDQSTGVVIEDQSKKQYRTVIVDRTGLMVNVLDVVTDISRGAGPLTGASKALAKITDGQCTVAIGQCATLVGVKDGPPPAAGDQPGYLAVADIPQPQAGAGTWTGNTPGKPGSLLTSGCENLDFSKVDADSSGARTYLLSDEPAGMPDSFGLDEAVFTMSDAAGATALTKQLTDNIESCKQRQLTASVDGEKSISGVGAAGAPISGKTYQITQKVNATTNSHFRLGIVTTGQRVIYTFLPTQDKFDLTDDQWTDLTLRAAARGTQAS